MSLKAMELAYVGMDTEAEDLMNGDAARLFKVADDLLAELVNMNEAEAKKSYEAGEAIYERGNKITVLMLLGTIVAGAFIAFLIIRGITGPVNKTLLQTDAMAKGDFTAKLDIQQKDEMAWWRKG